MIVASSSETKLDFANHRVGISHPAFVNRFIVRVVSVTIRIITRIIAIRIVPVVWIGVVIQRVTKITKEEKPIVEAAIVEPTAAKATSAKAIITKASSVKTTAKAPTSKASTSKTSTSKTTATEAAAVKASSTEAAATMTTTAPRHHV
jgi:hypothetical protein